MFYILCVIIWSQLTNALRQSKLLALNKLINTIAFDEDFDSDEAADLLVSLAEDSSDEVAIGNFFGEDSSDDSSAYSSEYGLDADQYLSPVSYNERSLGGLNHERCEFLTTTEIVDQLECEDDTLCIGWSCCNLPGRGGRKRCPPNAPTMCAKLNDCADGKDRCCETDCSGHGGPRVCDRRDPNSSSHGTAVQIPPKSECKTFRTPALNLHVIKFDEFMFAQCDSGYFGLGMISLLPNLSQQCRPDVLDLPFLLNCPNAVCKIRLPIRLGFDICDVIGLVATMGMASAYATAARTSVQVARSAIKAAKAAQKITKEILEEFLEKAVQTRQRFSRTMRHAKIAKASAGLCGFIQEAMERILRCIDAPNWLITIMLNGFDIIKRTFGEIAIEFDMVLSFDFRKIMKGQIMDGIDLDNTGWKIQIRLPCDQTAVMPTCLATAALTGHTGKVCWNFEVKMDEGKDTEINCLLVEEPRGAWALLMRAADDIFDWDDDSSPKASQSFKRKATEIKKDLEKQKELSSCHPDGHGCHEQNEPCCAGLRCDTTVGPMISGYGVCVNQLLVPQAPVVQACQTDGNGCHAQSEPCCPGLRCDTNAGPFVSGYGLCVSTLTLPQLSPARLEELCPWLTPTDSKRLKCNDGQSCRGWSCCKTRGGRAKCPANSPIMCAKKNDCANKSDYCCEINCDSKGGPRMCGAEDH